MSTYVEAPFDTDIEYDKEAYDALVESAVDKASEKVNDVKGESKENLYEIAQRMNTNDLDALIDFFTAVYDARLTTSRPMRYE